MAQSALEYAKSLAPKAPEPVQQSASEYAATLTQSLSPGDKVANSQKPGALQYARSITGSVPRGALGATGQIMSSVGIAGNAGRYGIDPDFPLDPEDVKAYDAKYPPGTHKPTNSLMQAGEAVSRFGQEQYPPEPSMQNAGTVGRFLGETLPEFAGAIAPTVLAGAVAGPGAAVLAGTGQQGAAGYYDALGHGASEEDAMKSYLLNLGVGALQALPVARYFGQLGKVEQSLMRRILVETPLASGSFAGATAAANTIANTLVGYDPNRPTSQGVGESLLLGGIAGGAGAALHPRGAVEPTANPDGTSRPLAKGEVPLLPPQQDAPVAAQEAATPLAAPEAAAEPIAPAQSPEALVAPPEQAPAVPLAAEVGAAAPGGEAAGLAAPKLAESGTELPVSGKPEPPITAYHGTPHTFEKFDITKIGTGEGAQAFGRGLYFTEKKAIAEHYQRKLSEIDTRPTPALLGALKDNDYLGFDTPGGAARAIRTHPDWKERWEATPELQAEADKWIADLNRQSGGNVYTVTLLPKPPEFLLWDKPLSAQSDKVKAGIEKLGIRLVPNNDPQLASGTDAARLAGVIDETYTGAQLYRWLLGNMPDRAAGADVSGELHLAGIRGIKYLTGESRGAGEGEHNYVVFSDEDVSIVPPEGPPSQPPQQPPTAAPGADQPAFPEGPVGDAAKTAFAEGEATEIGSQPNPIASTMEDPAARALQRGVREVRAGEQEVIPIEQQRQQAESRLAADRDTETTAVFDKIARGDALNPVETHIADIAQSEKVMAGLRSGDQATLADAVAKNWAYQDARATAGRTLGTIRDALRSPKEQMADILATPNRATREKLEGLKNELDAATTSPERKKAIKEQVRNLADLEGKKLADVRKALVDAGLDPALADDGYFKDLTSYAKIARIVSTKKATGWDWALEFWISNLVSGPLSQKANIVGNAANMVYDQHLKRMGSSLIGSALGRTDTATIGEVGAFYGHFLGHLVKAGRSLVLSYKHEVPMFEVDLHRKGVPGNVMGGAKEDIMSGPRIPGIAGRVIRAPGTTSLLAFDEFFKQLMYGPEAAALSYRAAKKEGLTGDALHKRMGEIVNDYKHPIHQESLAEAKRLTFQDEGGDLLKVMMLGRQKLNTMFEGVPVGSLIFPFVKTGALVFKAGLGIPLRPFITLNNVRRGKYKGNAALAVDDATRTLMSIAVTATLIGLVSDEDDDGLPAITGSAAPDRNERAAQYRTAPPYSIRIGGAWHDYRRVEPAAVAIATVVDLAQEVKRNPSPEALGALFHSVVDQASDKTFLRTIGDIIEAARDRENPRMLPNLLRDMFVTPLVPNVIRQPLRESDKYFRQPPARERGDDGFWAPWKESMGALRYLSWPSAQNAPPIKYDLWGRPMTRPYPQSTPVNRFLLELTSALPESAGGKDPSRYDLMILRYNDKVRAGTLKDEDARLHYPAPPEYAYMQGGKRHFWTDEEYARIQQISGEFALKTLNKIKRLNVKDPGKLDMDILGDVITQARKYAKFTVLREKAKAK